jgi:hypothetical protein
MFGRQALVANQRVPALFFAQGKKGSGLFIDW